MNEVEIPPVSKSIPFLSIWLPAVSRKTRCEGNRRSPGLRVQAPNVHGMCRSSVSSFCHPLVKPSGKPSGDLYVRVVASPVCYLRIHSMAKKAAKCSFSFKRSNDSRRQVSGVSSTELQGPAPTRYRSAFAKTKCCSPFLPRLSMPLYIS